MATTIPAGTLRLLLALISYRAKARKELRRKPPMVPRRPPRSCCWTAPPGKWCQPVRYDRLHGARSPAAGRGKHRDCRRANPVQVEALTSQQVSRAQHLPAIRRRQELPPPGWHGLQSAALSGLYSVRRGAGIWYALEVLRRCDTLQRGTGSIIADCVGLVSLAAERAQSQETPL